MRRSLIQDEFQQLLDKKFLLPSDNLTEVRVNTYEYEIWADVFWRRRLRHAKREDPELKHVFKTNPSSVLEIGAGYGRVLRKLLEWEGLETNSIKFTGIEICIHLKNYFQRYQAQYPSLRRTDIFFDNFLSTSSLEENSFDVIILPMNTLANFSYHNFESLFRTVHKYLAEDGMFIFSNYKIPDNLSLTGYVSKKHGYSGDLLLELGSGLITAE